MTKFITTLLNGSSSPFSIAPKTNYQKNATQSAQQLFKDNWFKTGNSLRSAYAPRESNGVSISKLHLGKEIQGFLKNRGINQVSEGATREFGDYLMKQIQESAKELADVLRKEFGEPKNG